MLVECWSFSNAGLWCFSLNVVDEACVARCNVADELPCYRRKSVILTRSFPLCATAVLRETKASPLAGLLLLAQDAKLAISRQVLA